MMQNWIGGKFFESRAVHVPRSFSSCDFLKIFEKRDVDPNPGKRSEDEKTKNMSHQIACLLLKYNPLFPAYNSRFVVVRLRAFINTV